MACIDRAPTRVPRGVIIHLNGNVMAGPYLMVRDGRTNTFVVFGSEYQMPRIFAAPHLAYHSLIRSFARWRRSQERRRPERLPVLRVVA